LVPLRIDAGVFRKEVPSNLVEIIAKQAPDIYINLLNGAREETPFRIKLTQMEIEGHKKRLGHCPGVTLDMLTDGALALTVEGHRQMQGFSEALLRRLRNAVRVRLTNPAGTDLTLSVEGRPFFTDTKIDWKAFKWMNLPTGEVTVAPVEDSLEGKLVCDLCVGGVGRVKTPVEITAKKGKASRVFSKQPQVLKGVEDSLNTDERSSTVGEFAFGINPKARVIDELLEAEKVLGTAHIAFGNNSDMPCGKNMSKNHMDFLVSKPTVNIFSKDGSRISVLVNGVFPSS